MTYQDKFYEHLARVEELNEKADEWQAWATKEVDRRHGRQINSGRNDAEAKANLRAMYLRQILGASDRYAMVTGSRNFNMEMAHLYFEAAMMQEAADDDDLQVPGPRVRGPRVNGDRPGS